MPRDRTNWMLADALEKLARAERMQQQFFRLGGKGAARAPVWEPPVDLLETDRELIVVVALPGVDPARVEARIENGVLTVAGQRVVPPELRNATIHRLELPQGRFERRISLPPGRFGVRHEVADGCLVFKLAKLG